MQNVNWQTSLKNLEVGVPSSRAKIRFNLPYVPISHIAKQFYCELQLDQEYKFGKECTSAEKEGAKLHEEILKAETVTLEELIYY